MGIKLAYIGFESGWPDFLDNNIIKSLLNNDDLEVKNIDESNVLVIGCFLNLNDLNKVMNYKGKRILYVSEPIKYLSFTNLFNFLFENRVYDYVIGCIENNKDKNWYKYPLYIETYEKKNNNSLCEEINNYVMNIDINNKKYCTLISRHDLGNCRYRTYEVVRKYGSVDCPGPLLNNMSNEYINRIGNSEFIKEYLFNICNENFGQSHPGYITEKLMNSCLGGAIPIYYGKLDEIDKRIFNIDRIILIDNLDDMSSLDEKLKYLMNNRDELEKFYKQPVFVETAKKQLNEMKNNPLEALERIRSAF